MLRLLAVSGQIAWKALGRNRLRTGLTPLGVVIGVAAVIAMVPLGNGALDRRVCRYSADVDGSGAVDTNLEHPPAYTDVDSSLAQQNFLVVNGAEACPTRPAVRVDGSIGDVFANQSTLAHQP